MFSNLRHLQMLIRPVQPSDATEWERMRQEIWPSDPGEHAREIALFFGGNRRLPAEVMLAIDDAGRVIGFAEVSIRPYAEGCYSGHVAFLEGWFVEAASRRKGIGRALVKMVEQWGREQACTELGSDTALDNPDGAEAHRAVGFTEMERIICFRKTL